VPYPFAHPAAVLPLARPMGRLAVPSALAIGSVVPDLAYLVPLVERGTTHSPAALLWFCLPAGLAVYGIFHLALKHPLLALLPRSLSARLGSFASPSLPAAAWHAVVVSVLVGALTHIAWDALTHSSAHAGGGHSWLQHASTLLGAAVLAWWILHKLRAAPVVAAPPTLSPAARACTAALLAAAMPVSAWISADGAVADLPALRNCLRAGLPGLAAALLAYCLAWQLRFKRAIPTLSA